MNITKNIQNAFRIILRHKLFSFINIIGLSIGFATSFLLLIYLINEFGYNQCHINKDKIYRVLMHKPHYEMVVPSAPYYFAESIKKEYPEIKESARYGRIWGASFEKDSLWIKERIIFACDPSIFDMFTLPVIIGNKEKFLQTPNSIVITERIAQKYFPNTSALGKELKMNMGDEIYVFTIDGVIKNIPKKSTFQADIIVSFDISRERFKIFYDKETYLAWDNPICQTYILLDNNNDIETLKNKLPKFKQKYLGKENSAFYSLQNLTDIYFHSNNLGNTNTWGSLNKIYTFSIVSILILIIAIFNYLILATVQSVTRFKEIGIRKVVGADNKELIIQIITENVLMSIIAVPISFLIMELSIPFINQLLQSNLSINYLSNYQFIIGVILISLIVGILAGTYLSILLSKYNPIKILTEKIRINNSKSFVRYGLIIFQIVIFVVFVIVSQIVSRQVNYAKNLAQGYNKENIIKIYLEDDFIQHIPTFIEDVNKNSNVINAGATSYAPPDMGWQKGRIKDNKNNNVNVVCEFLDVNYNFCETMEFKLLQGRTFSKDFLSDSLSVLISESTINQLHLPKQPIGQSIISFDGKEKYKIIGVFKDVLMRTVKQEPLPLIIKFTNDNLYEIVVRYRPGTQKETVAKLNLLMQKYNGGIDMEYISVTDYIDMMYEEDENLKNTLTVFTFLAILISSLGLFGFSLFIIKQKTKTIAIRKLHGASTFSILKRTIKEFLVLVSIANIISIPIAYYISNLWLSEFVYRVGFSVLPYFMALLLSSLIIFLTVIVSAYKTANNNPAKSIKYE